MPLKVVVRPELLRWARERVSWEVDDVAKALGLKRSEPVQEWEETGELSLSQLERLAAKTHTPIGYLFLSEPPKLPLPIPDFRRLPAQVSGSPSPNLLDTIYDCQLRQDWFREFLILDGEERLPFVGSVTVKARPSVVAAAIRQALELDIATRSRLRTYEETLSWLVERVEDAGILVMRNGVVRNNTHRKLNVSEFRGFTLCDPYAPLIFVNASDSRAAQMFTLAHELAHVWLGESGVSNPSFQPDGEMERFCNAVAAELLVPAEAFREAWNPDGDVTGEAKRLARKFKVSTLVILIRAWESKAITYPVFQSAYDAERAQTKERPGTAASGGDFYRTQDSRLGNRFARAVIASTLEGRTLYTEAFSLLGLKKTETFNNLARELGVVR